MLKSMRSNEVDYEVELTSRSDGSEVGSKSFVGPFPGFLEADGNEVDGRPD